MAETNSSTMPADAAYEAGRRAGLATGALALSIAAFINLLGLEKSLLAIVLAAMALRGGEVGTKLRGFARAAIVIAAVHVVTVVTVVAVFHERLAELIRLLRQLG